MVVNIEELLEKRMKEFKEKYLRHENDQRWDLIMHRTPGSVKC